MKLADIRLWLGRACIVIWQDSGAWSNEEDVKPKDMELAETATTGILVFANKEKIVLEHEKEPTGFSRQAHSVIATKCVISISNKKRA